jgi:hypothetical protein
MVTGANCAAYRISTRPGLLYTVSLFKALVKPEFDTTFPVKGLRRRSKRRMLDEDEQMARAEIWLQEQIARLIDPHDGDASIP